MARAVLYLRQSIAKEESISLEVQEAVCREYADKRGHTVVAVHSDPGISGRTFKRPGVHKALAAVEAGEAEVIVLWKWSRLSRARLDWAIATDRVESAGGRIESATEPMDTSTSSGRFARGVMAELAAFESERIGDGWREAHSRRVALGLPHNGPEQFGYTKAGKESYEVDPVTGPVLRELYLGYIAGRRFKDLIELCGRHGGPVSDYGVKKMLDRGFGAGLIWVRGAHAPGAHEGVVTELEFRRYQAARRARSRRPRAEASPFQFSGLVVCECGRHMAGNTVSKNGTKARRYYCPAVRVHDGHTNNIDEVVVERAVLDWLRGRAARLNEGAAQVIAREGGRRTADARPRIRRDLSKAAARIDTLTVKWLDGDVDKGTYERLLARLREERDDLQERLDALEAQEAEPAAPVSLVPDLLAAWPDMPAEARRGVVSKLIARIEVPRGRTRYAQKPLPITARWDQVG